MTLGDEDKVNRPHIGRVSAYFLLRRFVFGLVAPGNGAFRGRPRGVRVSGAALAAKPSSSNAATLRSHNPSNLKGRSSLHAAEWLTS